MNYMFDGKVAMEFGVDGAIMLQNLYFWIKKNEANNKHYHDGRLTIQQRLFLNCFHTGQRSR